MDRAALPLRQGVTRSSWQPGDLPVRIMRLSGPRGRDAWMLNALGDQAAHWVRDNKLQGRTFPTVRAARDTICACLAADPRLLALPDQDRDRTLRRVRAGLHVTDDGAYQAVADGRRWLVGVAGIQLSRDNADPALNLRQAQRIVAALRAGRPAGWQRRRPGRR